jgi:cyclase
MRTKRIIPCLDIKDGQTVKGIRFEELRFAGDPVQLGAQYARQGADELVFLDITATVEKRETLAALACQVAQRINIPFTVGGGIRSEQDVEALMANGADKITINSAAVKAPDLVGRLAKRFGSQCVVVAIDSKVIAGEDRVVVKGGREPTDRRTLAWAREVAERGAGEILLTSMDHDGTGSGFAVALTSRISQSVPIPVIASGGGGTAEHFRQIFEEGRADAALAASIFHFGTLPVPTLKAELHAGGLPIRV